MGLHGSEVPGGVKFMETETRAAGAGRWAGVGELACQGKVSVLQDESVPETDRGAGEGSTTVRTHRSPSPASGHDRAFRVCVTTVRMGGI